MLNAYRKLILDNPRFSLLIIILICVFFASKSPQFKLDASPDSLVLEHDEDLAYFRDVVDTYGTSDYLIITYTPIDELLSESSLDGIRSLKKELLTIDGVESVVSVLDVPLLDSPKVSFSDLKEGTRTLESEDTDRKLAFKEFTQGPIYSNLLVSPSGKTTAIQVNLKRDEKYYSLLKARNQLRDKKDYLKLSAEEEKEYKKAQTSFKAHLIAVQKRQNEQIKKTREIIDRHREKGRLFLGGVPMITSDLIDFIANDLVVFGIGVFLFLVMAFGYFFKKIRWVLIPLGCCFLVAVTMIGFLGFVDWRVTVISSNFLSILLIITMSLSIHLIVRYGELKLSHPEADQKFLVSETVRLMSKPCFYTSITTLVAFSSLSISNIRPVIDFGWIMTLGIAVAFSLSFVFFPTSLLLTKPVNTVFGHNYTQDLTLAIGRFSKKHKSKILGFSLLVGILSIVGLLRLEVENRFIDYFKTSTEIYQGMEVIDRDLGGTTPLDITILPTKKFHEFTKRLKEKQEVLVEESDDPFLEDEIGTAEEENYWFHLEPLLRAEKIHDYLETIPEIGKVQSIATLVKVIRHLNGGEMPDDYDLSVIRKFLPKDVKESLVYPYLSPDANQIRITLRMVEADPGLNRKQLIENIRAHLTEKMGVSKDRIRFTGMAVLYNNMLYSLYGSQIRTLGLVFVAIMIMFAILFRNIRIAAIAIVPNVFAACFILGVMGWLGIPLDMMTITIAAITIGIAVDDTIHYVHRFQEEFREIGHYEKTMDRCHGSIGRAIYYTTVTITFGFSILALSNFIPTIYFGLLTGLAMIIALLGDLMLLPLLILIFKPLGPEITPSTKAA